MLVKIQSHLTTCSTIFPVIYALIISACYPFQSSANVLFHVSVFIVGNLDVAGWLAPAHYSLVQVMSVLSTIPHNPLARRCLQKHAMFKK